MVKRARRIEVKIKVSPEIKDEVSPQLIKFVESVIKEEQLSSWNVHIWSCRGEGICSDVICFGLCEYEEKTKLLFLHEVAHALLNPKRSHYMKDWHEDSYWHKDGWSKEFDRLCNKYLGIKGQKDLFHD